MSRYIKESDFINAIAEVEDLRRLSTKTIGKAIDKCDSVEVVRCKECKHKVTDGGGYNPEDIVCDYWCSDGLTVNDYCSYGKRKEKEHEESHRE